VLTKQTQTSIIVVGENEPENRQAMIELEGEKYLDGDEASAMLGVKLATLYAYVSRGILRSYKQGIKRQRLYKQSELESLLRLRPGDTPSPTTSAKAGEGDDSVAAGKRPAVGPGDIPLAEDWVPYT
jgi:hypothetical protein